MRTESDERGLRGHLKSQRIEKRMGSCQNKCCRGETTGAICSHGRSSLHCHHVVRCGQSSSLPVTQKGPVNCWDLGLGWSDSPAMWCMTSVFGLFWIDISTWGIGFYSFVRSLTADVASLGKQNGTRGPGLSCPHRCNIYGQYTQWLWLWPCYNTKSIV